MLRSFVVSSCLARKKPLTRPVGAPTGNSIKYGHSFCKADVIISTTVYYPLHVVVSQSHSFVWLLWIPLLLVELLFS